MADYILSAESTVDMPYAYMQDRDIPVLFYSYTVDGTSYADDMGRNPGALRQFYGFLEAGKLPTTSQLNEFDYLDFFDGLLKKGDVLHIAFGSGMTLSVQNAMRAAETLREKYPERRIVVIDSLCSSSGYGMLVDDAADMRDAGGTLDEVKALVTERRQRIHHQFYSTRLDHYHRSGRVSGPAATIATVLSICPLMHLNAEGKIIAYDRIRGKLHAIEATVDTMERHAEGGRSYSGKCFICHSDCPEDAERTRNAVLERFPHIKGNIRIFNIGTIIASHCGPGTVAVFFLGDERE